MALQEHMQRLLANHRTADVTLVACPEDGGSGVAKEIPAHLSILSRSPVFERMFEAGTFGEGTRRRAEIPVPWPELLEQLVRYLYTDSFDFSEFSPDSDKPIERLLALACLLDMYEVGKAALRLVMTQLEEVMDGWSISALGSLTMLECARRPAVCKLLAEEEALMALLVEGVGDADAEHTARLLEASQRALHAGLPQSAVERIVASLAFFGDGYLLQVLTWVREMAARDSLTCVDWEKLQAICLRNVATDVPERLKSELQAEGKLRVGEPSLQSVSARALVLGTFVRDGFGVPPWSATCLRAGCRSAPMEAAAAAARGGRSSEGVWRFDCPRCFRSITVGTAATDRARPGGYAAAANTDRVRPRVQCLTHHVVMPGLNLSGNSTFFCQLCGNARVLDAPAETESGRWASEQLLEDVQTLVRLSTLQARKLQEMEASLARARGDGARSAEGDDGSATQQDRKRARRWKLQPDEMQSPGAPARGSESR